MENQELVSIITPVYNSERFIGETIESVLNQTYSNWELIIINDCSTDNTEILLEEYSIKDKRIRIINQPENSGVVNSRNLALGMAKGDFIAFLDSDDKWKQNKLEKQIEFMKRNKYAFSFTGYEYINEKSEKLNKVINVPNYQNYNMGLKNTIIGCLTVMIDKRKVGEFYMPNLKHGEDHFTWLEIMKKGYYAYGLNECLAEYRISSNSLSSNKINVLILQWKNYKNVAKLPLYKCIYYFSCYIFNATIKRI